MTLSYPKRQAILAAAGVAVQDGCVLLLEEIGPTAEGMPGSIARPTLGTYRLMQLGP
jgi:hypothetical protein